MGKSRLNLTLPVLLGLAMLAGCGLDPQLDPALPGPMQAQGLATTPVIPGTDIHLGVLPPRHPAPFGPRFVRPMTDLPPQVDLRAYCSPVGDQGKTNACSGWAIAKGLDEYLEIRSGQSLTSLSAEFLYYMERQMEGDTVEDGGVSDIGDGFKVLRDDGAAPESAWPDDDAHLFSAPTPDVLQAAQPFEVHQIAGVGTDLGSIKATLARGQGVVLAIALYPSVQQALQTGMIPMPAQGEAQLGGHAIFCCGYDDQRQVLILKNSWGTDKGDRGYFYLPYAYVTSTNVWQADTAS